MKNIITINSINRTLVINTIDNTIAARTNSGLEIVKKLSTNKDYVLKVNKTTISTCSLDMLSYILKNGFNDTDIFSIVYNDIARIDTAAGYTSSKSEFYNSFNDSLDDFVTFFNNAGYKTRRMIILDHCCTDHTAKMAGMISYSTYVGFNAFCQARRKKGCSVCAHCFAARQTKAYRDQANKLKRAHVIAVNCAWAYNDIPAAETAALGFKYFRLESFGDINNVTQVVNYNTLADALSDYDIPVTLWTKNPDIVDQALTIITLSDNLTIGLSSLHLNTPETEKSKKYWFIKFVFTVYTPEYVNEHNVNINCGGRHCLSCLNCYETARHANKLVVINELLK